MKKRFIIVVCLLAIILPLTLPVLATKVDVYSNYVIVRDKWPASISAGKKAKIEWNLPENIDQSSFTILNPEVDIISRVEEASSSLIGKLVNVQLANNKTYKGILKSKGAEISLVDPATGQIVAILNNSQIVAIIPEDRSDISTQRLKLELINNGKEDIETLDVRYLAHGISWNVKYSLEINDDKAVLFGEYQIENSTNKPFEAASIRLITKRDLNSPYGARDAVVMLKAQESYLPSVEQDAETAIYNIPGEVNIPAESRIRLRLLKEDELKVERRYTMNYNQVDVEVTLDGISQILPQGELNIFDNDILSTTQYLKSQPQSGKLVLNLGQTLDISGRREQLRHYKTGSTFNDEYKVTLRNDKQDEVKVEVVAFLPRENADVTATSEVSYRRLTANTVVFDVLIPANEEFSFNYTFSYTNN